MYVIVSRVSHTLESTLTLNWVNLMRYILFVHIKNLYTIRALYKNNIHVCFCVSLLEFFLVISTYKLVWPAKRYLIFVFKVWYELVNLISHHIHFRYCHDFFCNFFCKCVGRWRYDIVYHIFLLCDPLFLCLSSVSLWLVVFNQDKLILAHNHKYGAAGENWIHP